MMPRDLSSQTQKTVQMGEDLVAQILDALRDSQQITRTTKHRHQQWRATAKPQAFVRDNQNAGADMFGALFAEMVLGGVFGLPMFGQLNAGLTEAMHGAALTGTVGRGAEENATFDGIQEFVADNGMEEMYASICEQVLAAQRAQQSELSRNKKMLLMAMMTMLLQEERAPREEIVPDILRKPAVARFKQNRHSIDCIRSAFARQADSVVAPHFTAPKYRMAG